MKVTYTPDKSGTMPETTSQFGYEFTAGKAVDVSDPAHLTKFRGNRFFAVDEAKGHTGSDDKKK